VWLPDHPTLGGPVTSGPVVRLSSERLRVVPWRGHADIAQVSPMPNGPPPDAIAINRCLRMLAERRVHEVVTGALAPAEQQAFLDAGFTVRERLHLLSRPLRHLPDPPPIRTRRPRRSERAPILALDQRAFDEFWRLDGPGLNDALSATATARLRVVAGTPIPPDAVPVPDVDHRSRIDGYAVTGRSGTRGYLQRLAVDPRLQGRGIAAALVIDGLRWLRRHGAERAVVNTQVGNESALRLYYRLDFRPEPEGLAVLTSTTGAGRP
jgi:ribosomal protein S18 acetylase RimI-like enzyme